MINFNPMICLLMVCTHVKLSFTIRFKKFWLKFLCFYFIPGDRDGKGSEARLQHALDAKYLKQNDKEYLLVADTYNHALKLIDLKTKFCQKLQLETQLNEPNGLCIDPTSQTVYICDTNNHSIKRIESFDVNKTTMFNINELKLTNQNLTELIESIELKNEILVEINFELNFEASNNWQLAIFNTNEKVAKLELQGVFERKKNLNGLYKLTSIDSESENIKLIELHICVCYCEQSNTLGNICKILKKKFTYTRENMLNRKGCIVLTVQI